MQWHFFSFVGAHDFLDCKGKKVAESEEVYLFFIGIPAGLGAASGRRVLGGVLGVSSGLVGLFYTQVNSGFMEPLILKIGRFFLCACGNGVDWPHVA